MIRALVTGATGFVGGALARDLINRGVDVVAIVRDGEPPPGCKIVRGQLEDLSVCERAIVNHRPDTVFHLAAQAIVGHSKLDPFATFESNVRGTYNLMEAIRRHGKNTNVIVASSDKAYGDLKREKYVETDPLEGRGAYDCSKSCTDLIAQSYSRSFMMNVAIIRAGNIYGPGDNDMSRIVPSICADLIAGRSPTILSDGTPVRDYIYISDAVWVYEAAERYLSAYGGVPRAFNISGQEPVSVLDLVQRMCFQYKELTGQEPKPISVTEDRHGEIQAQLLDNSRSRKELGFYPAVTLDSGLYLTLEDAIKQW